MKSILEKNKKIMWLILTKIGFLCYYYGRKINFTNYFLWVAHFKNMGYTYIEYCEEDLHE